MFSIPLLHSCLTFIYHTHSLLLYYMSLITQLPHIPRSVHAVTQLRIHQQQLQRRQGQTAAARPAAVDAQTSPNRLCLWLQLHLLPSLHWVLQHLPSTARVTLRNGLVSYETVRKTHHGAASYIATQGTAVYGLFSLPKLGQVLLNSGDWQHPLNLPPKVSHLLICYLYLQYKLPTSDS